MANAKRRRAKTPNFTDRVHAAMAESPLHSIMLNLEEAVTKLATSSIELRTGMQFVVTDATEAKQSRRGIHDKLNDLGAGQARTEERLTTVERDVKGLRSDVNRHEAIYQQNVGKQNFIRRVCGMVATGKGLAVSLAAAGGGSLAAWWQGWHPFR